MGLNIKNERVEKLARDLADATGETMTAAIGKALQERLDRVAPRPDAEEKIRRYERFWRGSLHLRRVSRATTPTSTMSTANSMIVDASAVLAILMQEPEGPVFYTRMAQSTAPLQISPVNYIEVAAKGLRSRNSPLLVEIDHLLSTLGVSIATLTPGPSSDRAASLRDLRQGRHPARLNIGDCFAYALAKSRREPLLYKGSDFSQTDIEAAL
jgi:ribonuclease VapC